MKRQSGFTLIELMIVVAIIAILAAIALPLYSDYTKKAKVAAKLSEADAYKTTVALCKQTGYTDCSAGKNGVPAVEGAVTAVATDGTITMTTGVAEVDNLILKPTQGSATLSWAYTGKAGCGNYLDGCTTAP